jgi:hypothetical protein
MFKSIEKAMGKALLGLTLNDFQRRMSTEDINSRFENRPVGLLSYMNLRLDDEYHYKFDRVAIQNPPSTEDLLKMTEMYNF